MLQIFSGNGNRPLAEAIAAELNIPLGQAIVGQFKNGEVRIRLEENVRGNDVFVVQSICEPVDHHIMELCFLIDALHRSSAGRITAVIPYFAYARQEKKTSGREPISAKLVAKFIESAGADRVLTVDLHAPAIEGFFEVPVDHLRAGPLIAEHVRKLNLSDMVVVSPDPGGVGRAIEFRQHLDAGLAIIAKQRTDVDVVDTFEMVGDVNGKCAVIIDDMISTGGTLAHATNLIKERGAAEVLACAVHGLFAGNALEELKDTPLRQLIVTDTYPVSQIMRQKLGVEVITVAPMMAEAIHRIHTDQSISLMFNKYEH